jgi:hypothetical protein
MTTMSASRDRRLLDQAARSLRRTVDWLQDLDTVEVDGSEFDKLGEVIFAVDEALEEAGGDA